MQSLRQLGNGFFLGILSIVLVLGAFALALAEGGLVILPAPSPTLSPAFPTLFPTLPLLVTQPGQDIPTIEPTLTPTPPPPPTACPPPAGWQPVVVQPYDTLESLAALYRLPAAQLQQANCLVSAQVSAGSYIYVPFQATSTPIPCGAPFGWGVYIIQPGDTLYRISILYRVGIAELQQANCLGYSTYIITGQPLRVPNVPTSTATFTIVVPASATPTETITTTPLASPTDTLLPSDTPSALPLPSDTPSALPLPSDTPSALPLPSDTPLPTSTP
ncbi:MAG: hypothetical protein CO094_09355 [Anaerolineae bacterium CG_4_9_14_3_um_filter_57_17]|nr:LysM peptidoglycan-binding domain-containing protein [bacterium]OIO86829.1 MAG: hypothetical protein AUK01_01720 [Anaerolineae bacterium CG2_30_57_67]PJB65638.1 MAG: hypothetical protein CO094_09355 [Anaerolineae bacterium CG_4_9_14_3_um_filter_57_17]